MQCRLCAFILFWAFGSHASADTTAVVRLYDQVASFLPPPWVKETNAQYGFEGQVEVSRQQGVSENNTDRFLLEFIPKGESFESWSELYAITAEKPLSGSAEGYMNGQVNVYANACDPVAYQNVVEQRDWRMTVIFCGKYTATPKTGEIAVFSQIKTGQMLVKHYYHKRGSAFDVNDMTSFPLPSEDLQSVIDRLGAMRLAPADN